MNYKNIHIPDVNFSDYKKLNNSKMLILDDYNILLSNKKPLSKKMTKLISKLSKYNKEITIKFGEFNIK